MYLCKRHGRGVEAESGEIKRSRELSGENPGFDLHCGGPIGGLISRRRFNELHKFLSAILTFARETPNE